MDAKRARRRNKRTKAEVAEPEARADELLEESEDEEDVENLASGESLDAGLRVRPAIALPDADRSGATGTDAATLRHRNPPN